MLTTPSPPPPPPQTKRERNKKKKRKNKKKKQVFLLLFFKAWLQKSPTSYSTLYLANFAVPWVGWENGQKIDLIRVVGLQAESTICNILSLHVNHTYDTWDVSLHGIPVFSENQYIYLCIEFRRKKPASKEGEGKSLLICHYNISLFCRELLSFFISFL